MRLSGSFIFPVFRFSTAWFDIFLSISKIVKLFNNSLTNNSSFLLKGNERTSIYKLCSYPPTVEVIYDVIGIK